MAKTGVVFLAVLSVVLSLKPCAGGFETTLSNPAPNQVCAPNVDQHSSQEKDLQTWKCLLESKLLKRFAELRTHLKVGEGYCRISFIARREGGFFLMKTVKGCQNKRFNTGASAVVHLVGREQCLNFPPSVKSDYLLCLADFNRDGVRISEVRATEEPENLFENARVIDSKSSDSFIDERSKMPPDLR